MKRLACVSLGLATMLLASQASALGVGAAGPRVGGVGRVGVAPGSISGVSVNGAVTVHGITVLPNGQMIVPAVTPRNLSVAPRTGSLPLPREPVRPCPYSNCGQ